MAMRGGLKTPSGEPPALQRVVVGSCHTCTHMRAKEHVHTRVPLQLEMIDGEIWANIWQTECIARICPATGRVTGWVLMHGLREALVRRNLPMHGKYVDVLNGARGRVVRRV